VVHGPGAQFENRGIKDVRQDLNALRLPFVIGVMGQNGSKPATGAMLTIEQAQLAMNDVPEFAGNVKAIRTDVLGPYYFAFSAGAGGGSLQDCHARKRH